MRRLVQKDLLQPLQHELIPNMEANVWPSLLQPRPLLRPGVELHASRTRSTRGAWPTGATASPTTRPRPQGWDALWNNDYNGAISLYDSYGDTIAITILRNGSLDVNTGDPALIEAAKEAILQTINDNEARLTINGVYAKLPAGDYHGRGGLVGRHRRRAVVPAEGRRHRRPRLLASADRARR